MAAGKILRSAILGLALALVPASVHADEMQRLWAQIVANPADTELNLRYAELAEAKGDLPKALAAYERIRVNDPNNAEAQAGLQRVRRKLQPDTTRMIAEFGGGWESNPRRVTDNSSLLPFGFRRGDDWMARARIQLRDERKAGETLRWRTVGTLGGQLQNDYSDLNFGYARGYTGPLFDLTPQVAVHAAFGGGMVYFDDRVLFKDVTASLAFESFLEGAFQTVRLRGGWRTYNSFFPSDDGFFADAVGKFSTPNVFVENDAFIFSPWLRWSGIGGVGLDTLDPFGFIEVQPGKYWEIGARIEYFRRLTEGLSIGAGIAASWRKYARTSTEVCCWDTIDIERRDVMLAPSATLIFHNVFNYQTDLRLDYAYEHNDSNDPVRSYDNHVVTMMLIARR